jgi:PAS domain S-box-containing protein
MQNIRLPFLEGGGEMGALMRAHNWSTSPLGSPDDWPASLRTVVGLLLNSKFPMFVAWGPALGLLYNDPYAEILGDKHPGALGLSFRDIWAETWKDMGPLLERVLAGEATYSENLPFTLLPDGYAEKKWFTFSYSPVCDESGMVVGLYCCCTETTAQVLAARKGKQEHERLRQLFEQAPGIMAVLREPSHIFELANTAYLELVGYRTVIGKTVREALPEIEGQGFFELLDRVYKTGEPFVGRGVSVKLQRPSGELEERFVDFIYQPTRDDEDNVNGIFIEGSDVTQAVKTGLELRAANRHKDEFVAMLAHELRNPLAPISTAAELLKLTTSDPVRIREVGEVISRQVNHMTALVDDLLDMSRITRGLLILNKEALNLNRIVAEAIEQVNALIELKHQHLAIIPVVGPALVNGDKTRLTQVFANLINNAAKYTPEYGHITVRVELQQRDVEVTIHDDGIGISAELLPRIFDLFVQAERTLDRSQGGLGLGLSLTKKLMDLHGGAVAARSEGIGRGSEFTVRLPRLCEPALEFQSRDDGSTALNTNEAMHLMIVDDNADAANLLSLLVEELGHTTTVALNASIALERAHEHPPQMLFLDIGLPDMDGYELARRLRTMPETEEAVLVAVTGYGQWEDKERARAAGFDHHLVKPINLTEITALIVSLGHETSIKNASR